MSQKKKTGKGQKKKRGQGVLPKIVKVALANKWRILGWSLLSLVAIGTWYFRDCHGDRKKALSEFKQAYLSVRAAEEQYTQTVKGIITANDSYDHYLKQDTINIAVLKEEQNYMLSMLSLGNANCNKQKEAAYKFLAAWRELARLFLLEEKYPLEPDEETTASMLCSNWGSMLQMVAGTDLDKVSNDRTLRTEMAKGYSESRSTMESILAFHDQRMTALYRESENFTRDAENQQSSVSGTCWECAKHLFGFTKSPTLVQCTLPQLDSHLVGRGGRNLDDGSFCQTVDYRR